jgi:hypothetical protein
MAKQPPDPILAETEILPQLFDEIRDDSVSSDDMFRKYEKIVAARLITTALTNPNAAKASAAAKDILDRVQGKATEKKDSKHRLEKISDKELKAVLASKLKKVRTE